MIAPIITRALLEKYLRATGWSNHREEWYSAQPGRSKNIRPPLPGEEQRWIAYAIEQICSSTKWPEYSHEVAARIAMCAAAEYHLAAARRMREPWTGHPVDSPRHDACEAEADLERYHASQILRMAGVDPERWEQAREGGS